MTRACVLVLKVPALKILAPFGPTPALRLSNALATLRGSRACAGAAMVCAPTAASKALALTRMSRPRFRSAWLSPYLSKPDALLTFARSFGGHATMFGLSGRNL
jgi:hypothetical protein